MTEEKLKDYCNELTPNIPQRRIRIEPVERTEDWIVYPAEQFTITDEEYAWIMSLCFRKG